MECDLFDSLLIKCTHLANSLGQNFDNALLLVATCPQLLDDLMGTYNIFSETDHRFIQVIIAAVDEHHYGEFVLIMLSWFRIIMGIMSVAKCLKWSTKLVCNPLVYVYAWRRGLKFTTASRPSYSYKP